MTNPMGADSKVLRAIDRSSNGAREDLVTLSTGVILKINKVSRSIYADILAQFTEPDIPTVYIEDKGREEENPDDPAYKKRLRKYNVDVSKALSDATILLGTELHECPSDVTPMSNREWLDKMAALRYDVKNKSNRYLLWVKTVAIGDENDYQLINQSVGRLNGVTETDAAQAVKQFPS